LPLRRQNRAGSIITIVWPWRESLLGNSKIFGSPQNQRRPATEMRFLQALEDGLNDHMYVAFLLIFSAALP